MSLDNKLAALRRLRFFANFEMEALRLLAFSAQDQKYSAGEYMFQCGERLSAAHLIITGSIILISDKQNEETARIVASGVLIGVRALFTETQSLFSAIANENSATLKISRELLSRVLAEFPSSAAAIRNAVLEDIVDFRSGLTTTFKRIKG